MSTRQLVVQRELALEHSEYDTDSPFAYDPHVYDGERCIHCNVNVYDDGIYGPFPCVPHEPVTYTTTTGDAPVVPHEVSIHVL